MLTLAPGFMRYIGAHVLAVILNRYREVVTIVGLLRGIRVSTTLCKAKTLQFCSGSSALHEFFCGTFLK